MIRAICVCALLAAPACPQDFFFRAGQDAQVGRAADADYQKGLRELDGRQWNQAIASFNTAAQRKGPQADAALYWKAYAENRAGRREAAFASLTDLRENYPSSRWLHDAQALQVEMRAKAGDPVSPGAEQDEELKLLAINSLMQSDPEAALPILGRLLSSQNPLKVKDRALFVLTQSSAPEARTLLDRVAHNAANPELQASAIRYMGMEGNDESRKQLAALYTSSSDERVKREILQGFALSGSRAYLLNAAKNEKNPELRSDAIRGLAMSGGQDELWQLYQGSNSVETKEKILKSMFMGGNSPKLAEIARDEKDARLRLAAIQSLGLMGENGRGDLLVSIYRSDQNPEIRNHVLNSLFLQQNGKALVALAREEKDPKWKAAIVQKMSLVHTKETTDYMLELLK